jgi:hypothetical protein
MEWFRWKSDALSCSSALHVWGIYMEVAEEGNWLATIVLFRGKGGGAHFLRLCGGTKQNLDEMRVPHKYETQKVHLPHPSTVTPVICTSIYVHLTSRSSCSRQLQTVGVPTTQFHPIRVIIAYLLLPLAVRQHLVGDSQTRPAELVGRHQGWVFCSLTKNIPKT